MMKEFPLRLTYHPPRGQQDDRDREKGEEKKYFLGEDNAVCVSVPIQTTDIMQRVRQLITQMFDKEADFVPASLDDYFMPKISRVPEIRSTYTLPGMF